MIKIKGKKKIKIQVEVLAYNLPQTKTKASINLMEAYSIKVEFFILFFL
jgi:hypothetical protein